VKIGVKRKADSTTTTANHFDPLFKTKEMKSAKPTTQRESGRQIKKVGTLMSYHLVKYIVVYSASCLLAVVSSLGQA
jgi:hypothetical protein